MNWNDITLKKFYEIQEILSVEDEYTMVNLIDCIYNVDSQSMPLHKIKEYDISFLKTDIPKPEIKKTYTLNGTTYNSNFDLTSVSVAQFIDYQNYLKQKPVKYEDILSVFFMPTSAKEYNTGYDISKVKEDLLELPITVVTSISFFFKKQLELFVMLIHYYLQDELNKIEMTPKMRNQLMKHLDKMQSLNSELFRTF